MIGGPGTPFRMILEEEVQRSAAIQLRNLHGNPRRRRRSSTYSHLTESNAFRMSSLNRSDGVLHLPAGKVAHAHEVIVYASRLDEGALGVGDKFVHVRSEAEG